MNAKQRRLVRRGLERMKTEEMAFAMGYEHYYPLARHVEALIRKREHWTHYLRRKPARLGRRDPRAYGLRCHLCGRPAHVVDDILGPECRMHYDGVPF